MAASQQSPQQRRLIVTYPQQEVRTVSEMLQPRQPLVRSNVPSTKPKPPSFLDAETQARRAVESVQTRFDAGGESERVRQKRMRERKELVLCLEFLPSRKADGPAGGLPKRETATGGEASDPLSSRGQPCR
eukprot:NODE_1977_length_1235_cov_36.683811_g1641_i0.p4 GENE.NODE_1977_length_1235_cov_36.683811_g1641_i0~~NODE_1977_length_1235_cov_36.683811_g1641_i0.p4  ORF type:complete len:131 (+),score=9.19 NODE_1977_length_1235_cov_36.683811_g1641_i0:275-667(+)